jgi:3-oxoacyl-[acyl-carrier protein] reductase
VATIEQAAVAGGFSGAAHIYNASDNNQAAVLSNAVMEAFGDAPDIVVCNAAVNADTLLMRMKDDDWQRVLDANLSGVFYLARAAVPAMLKKRRGRIIAISSVVAHSGNAGQSNYCAAKAGVENLQRRKPMCTILCWPHKKKR